MKKKQGFYLLFFVAIILAVMAYSNSFEEDSLIKEAVLQQEPADVTEDEEVNLQFELEEKLESKKEEGGYIVETYREYEVYRNEKGEIINAVPTSNFSYLRYEAE